MKEKIKKAQENYKKGYLSALHKSLDLLKETYPDDFSAMDFYKVVLEEITRVENMKS